MTKIYGIYGVRQALIQIPVGDGKAYLMREFTKGNPQGGPYYRPATYVSVDTTEQAMIENSKLFNHQITIFRQFGEEAPKPAAEPVQAAKPATNPAALDYPDVTNIDEARVVCKSLGAKAQSLTTEGGIKNFMAKKNITFSNFEF